MAAVGVIGLGLMGGAMAARLVEVGHDVLGFDVDSGSRSRAEEAGVRTTDALTEIAQHSEAIITSLPNGKIVRRVWMGHGGLFDVVRPGTTLIEVSTIDPQTMRDLAAAAPDGVSVIDAPVSGGPMESRSGTLTFLLGGDDDDIAKVNEVLEALSSTRHQAGVIGDGKTIKLANNVMSAANILVGAEAFEMAVAAGMEPRRAFEILSKSGGVSSQFVKRFPWVLEGDFRPRFTVALALKDLGLALDLARSLGLPAPMTAAAREMYQIAVGAGHADDDMVVVSNLYRHWAAH